MEEDLGIAARNRSEGLQSALPMQINSFIVRA
jgi:hypothetical protein